MMQSWVVAILGYDDEILDVGLFLKSVLIACFNELLFIWKYCIVKISI